MCPRGRTRTHRNPISAVSDPAAPELADFGPDRPADEQLGVIGDRFLELDPRLGQPCHVDGEDQRLHDT